MRGPPSRSRFRGPTNRPRHRVGVEEQDRWTGPEHPLFRTCRPPGFGSRCRCDFDLHRLSLRSTAPPVWPKILRRLPVAGARNSLQVQPV
ncbi:hypothetical protein BHE74_00035734 [Ensete ventricosum]|uniref:Uncharacterized protein n=1 Tax=Ensete ventricosum TaxID=4639 RepID=A0A444EEB4_ENSVE|nr:hypothetical protein GW17_00027829 [Ensete ventricosum]RWW57467.1 hypothetical protein BHE74_00035734 [Ensete ventricosum]RZR70883.1 hypothetical protein BHM03_00002084 [Ensete ventricosum]